MYLNRDYVNLVDHGKDYLDKPHLHFWLCAFSYKIFGVTTFAYKLPSFLFTILGTWSVWRLGKALFNPETGRLAALIIASAFAYMLANNDVRMDAILTACVAFATWQGVEFIHHKKLLNAAGLALGLALGFSTKGHIAVATPAIGLFFYILYRKEWKLFINWRWLVVLACFAIFIFPVVYCYYLQYNLHPEKVVRGKDHIDGVKFILLGQSIERLQGDSFGSDASNDYLFFIHSFLWAFAPWSILAYVIFISRRKEIRKRKEEWLTPATFLIFAIMVSVSGFKLPHYLNIIFPATAVMVASAIVANPQKQKPIFIVQSIMSALILLVAAVVNVWAFPVTNIGVMIGAVLLLAVFFYFAISDALFRIQKAICFSVAAISLLFFLLNTNFYPKLLTYQGGNELARKIKGNVDPANVYFWKDNYSSSFNFYTATERQQFTDSIYIKGKKPIWLLFDKQNLPEIQQAGYTIGMVYSTPDYEITKLDIKFVNPSTRNKSIKEMVIGEITGKQ